MVYLNRFFFKHIQLSNNFAQRSVSFCFIYLYVSAGADVVIAFYNFFLVNQTGKFFNIFNGVKGSAMRSIPARFAGGRFLLDAEETDQA